MTEHNSTTPASSGDPLQLSRRRFLGAASGVAALTLVPFLSACGSDSDSGGSGSGGSGGGGGSVTYGQFINTDPHLDPLQQNSHNFTYAVFDSLTYVSPGNDVAPQLATKWTRTDDTTVVFELDPKAVFSDGTPVTAADVKFSIDTIIEQGYTLASVLSTIDTVTADDDHTLTITTKTPDAILDRRLGLVFIVPKAHYEKVGPEKFGQSPIGSGKYTVTGFQPDTRIDLAANAKSWRGQPASAKGTIRQYTDSNAFVSSFLAGELDVAQSLPANALPRLEQAGGTIDVRPNGNLVVISLDTTKAPFDDVRVRKAVNLAINVQELVDTVLNGAGRPLAGQLASDLVFGYDPSIKAIGFDPDEAKRLLAEAGHPDGFKTKLTGLEANRAALEASAGYLQKVGIEVELDIQPFNVWVEAFRKGSKDPMFMKGIYTSPLFDADLAFQWPTAPMGEVPADGFRQWDDATWNEMLADERQELDPEARLTKLQKMSTYLLEELPYVLLYEESLVYGIKDGVEDFDPSTGLIMLTDSARKA
jgi:peptide/nickel transport system substrate-binding protein